MSLAVALERRSLLKIRTGFQPTQLTGFPFTVVNGLGIVVLPF
jgi:hypothetical protein